MLSKTKHLKFITKSLAVLALLGGQMMNGQEVIEEVETSTPVQDTVKTTGTQKVDGVAGVVGEYIVLDSDIDKAILQLKAQGVSTKEFTRCQLFGKLLEDKLYAHHAIQDSIEINDAEIRSQVDYQIQQFLQQSNGSMEELLKFYKKPDEKSFRDEMYEINKANKLAAEMQRKIVGDVEVTPEEVREFFAEIPEDQRPTFGTELKVSQIIIEPKVSEEETQRVINKLKGFKDDVENNGSSFTSKVVLYTEDAASKRSGGKYTLNREQPRMVKEFRNTAFSLQEGEISEPFKTIFGYHIIYLEKIRGKEYDVRHILLMPRISNDAITEAKNKLEDVRNKIISGELTFEEAAKQYSDEEKTKVDGGRLINPTTQDYNFELTKMDPELYSQIQNLKEGEVSLVLTDEDRTQRKKFKLLKVSDRVDEHVADYSKDYLKIKELALNEKKLKAIEKWQREKINDTYIKVNGNHRSCDFSSNWLKK